MSEEGSSHGPAAEDTAPAGPMLCMHAWGAPPAGLGWACSQQDPAPTDSDGPDVFLSSLQLGPRLESITGCLLFPVRDPPLAAAPFAATAPRENTCLRPLRLRRLPHLLAQGCQGLSHAVAPWHSARQEPCPGRSGTGAPSHRTLSTPGTAGTQDGATARQEPTSGPCTESGQGLCF